MHVAVLMCLLCMLFLTFGRNIGSHLSINKSVDACIGTDSHVTSLEHVQARLTLSYNRRGNLAIHLISPAGTRSTLLHPRYKHSDVEIQYKFGNTNTHTHKLSCLSFSCRPHDYSSEGFNEWAFMTTHSWDENPTGMWMLEIENVAGASDYGKASLLFEENGYFDGFAFLLACSYLEFCAVKYYQSFGFEIGLQLIIIFIVD